MKLIKLILLSFFIISLSNINSMDLNNQETDLEWLMPRLAWLLARTSNVYDNNETINAKERQILDRLNWLYSFLKVGGCSFTWYVFLSNRSKYEND